ncbi:MAG: gamma carbonic anhydrase family protein [Candidatus Eiseniibacteriota bacterium]|nr:MAG: gamma carbonic anhydrase family protein [Candidatus Eisenbacteria bacterium]
MIGSYKGKTPRLGKGVFVAPNATVIGDVSIGDFSSIWFGAVVRGDDHFVRIGQYTNVQDGCVLHVTVDRFPLVIGDGVTIGHGCILHGSRLGNNCLIGMGAVIMDGAEIGEGCIVASGSVVLQGTRIEPGTLVAGIPAVKKKEVGEGALAEIRKSAAEYAELASWYREEFR